MSIPKPARTLLLDLCKQLGVIAVMVSMAVVFMAATEEIGAQTSEVLQPPDLSQPEQVAASPEAQRTMPTLQDFAQQQTMVAGQDKMELDLAEVRRSYRGQLEEYRTLHQQFVVARQEFQQLGTLSSLEAAVQATQRVVIIRDRVLLSYLTILDLETRLAQGIDPALEERSLIALDETQKAITRHLEDTQAASSREAMAIRSAEFEDIEELYTFTVTFSKQVLQLASLSDAHSQAQDILGDVPAELSSQTELERAARNRALEQIELNLQNAESMLDEINVELTESYQKASIARINDFEDVFAILQRVVGFLDEVHLPTEN